MIFQKFLDKNSGRRLNHDFLAMCLKEYWGKVYSFENNTMSTRTIILLLLAIATSVLYGIGFKTSSLGVFIVAVLVELGFWFKLMNTKKDRQAE